MPKHMQLKMASPSKMALSHKEKLKFARREMGADMGTSEQHSFRVMNKRLKK